jgi:hypothetical protein
MSEEQIERRVETDMNVLDRQYMDGRITTAEYENGVRRLSQWASRQYHFMRTMGA